MKTYEWSDVKQGQVWRNKATSRLMTVTKAPTASWGKVHLYQHTSGRNTEQQAHYFVYNCELVGQSEGLPA